MVASGDVVNGYRLIKKLGEGSSGAVWSASCDTKPEIGPIVLKFINLTGWQAREFENEAKLLSVIVHPNIIRLHDSFQTKKHGVLVMEKMKQDLLQYVDAFEISESEGRAIFRQVLEAVAFCHSRGVAHMDIKPENIVISSEDHVKLVDFGSGCTWALGTIPWRTGQVGTSFYCAPEVRNSKAYRADKADIWSLGILLHVILTGFWPYLGKNESQVLANANIGNVDLASDDLSSNSIQILNLMLQLDPAARPSAEELLENSWFTEKSCSFCFTPRGGALPEDAPEPEPEPVPTAVVIPAEPIDEPLPVPPQVVVPPQEVPHVGAGAVPVLQLPAQPLVIPAIAAIAAQEGIMKTPRRLQYTPRSGQRPDDEEYIRPTPRSNLPPKKSTLSKIINSLRKSGKKKLF